MRSALDKFKEDGVDAYLYSGPIEKSGYEALCNILEGKKKSSRALLYLVTNGGNPNAGYRIARAMCHHYESQNFRVAIPAECKSAGTLICIGASSLVFFDRGELGPLDIQLKKQDEIFEQSSGLDILRGMAYLRNQALVTFNSYLLDINGGSGLSTKLASEIASKLVIGLYEPVYAQIDPIRLGEINGALQIANHYGNRLAEKSKNLREGALEKLINNYPTHGFVIDRAEAKELFNNVQRPSEAEAKISEWALWLASRRPQQGEPRVFDLIDFFDDLFKEGSDGGNATEGTESAADVTVAGSVGEANADANAGT